jgi:gamma-glutamyl hercynylcysteine S-oxide synthase
VIGAHCARIVAECAATFLVETPRVRLTLADGALPPLSDYSFEDKAAKGLRAAPVAKEAPRYFTALELAAEAPRLLLVGPRGCGKTVFARRLALHLAGERIGDPRFNLATLRGVVPRGEDDAVGLLEEWTGEAPVPVLLPCPDLDALRATGAPLLLILDDAEAQGLDGFDDLRVLALGDEDACGGWALPPGFRRHRLQPLLPAKREAWRARCGGAGALPGDPGLLSFAVAQTRPHADAVAGWIAEHAPARREALLAAGFAAVRDGAARLADAPAMLDRRFAFDHLAALHLAGDPARAAALFKADPGRWGRMVRLMGEAVVPALAAPPCPPAAALLAAQLSRDATPALAHALHEAVAGDALPLPQRVAAGAQLARHGDPRDLDELCDVPGGAFVMGSGTHPNAAAPHVVHVAPFRIGRYPVANRLYARFIAESGRPWRSEDGRRADRANAPAVDLTWHDARACCAWLTARWRLEGRILAGAVVRLPTEPEWEYAARGAQPDGDGIVYPWHGGWQALRCNSDEAGLNDTCAMGLFPAGASWCGAEDMAGNIWEWCSTLWGEEMAAPRFRYPYAADGREDGDAGSHVRRVLRGGCFSSGREKACCTYRGSLEPEGFWRGNGFRVVVAGG